MSELAARLVDAFDLPAAARIDRRISKAALTERAPALSLRKLIVAQVERLDWVGELAPATIGVAACDAPPVPQINLFVLTPAAPPTQRLWEFIHGSIPAPLVLLTDAPGGVTMTCARVRKAERINAVVAEALEVAPVLTLPLDVAGASFIASLSLDGLPQTDLGALYEGVIVRMQALAAARAGGAAFRVPATAADAAARAAVLVEHRALAALWAAKRQAAAAEKRLAQRVALGDAARALQAQLSTLAARLA